MNILNLTYTVYSIFEELLNSLHFELKSHWSHFCLPALPSMLVFFHKAASTHLKAVVLSVLPDTTLPPTTEPVQALSLNQKVASDCFLRPFNILLIFLLIHIGLLPSLLNHGIWNRNSASCVLQTSTDYSRTLVPDCQSSINTA